MNQLNEDIISKVKQKKKSTMQQNNKFERDNQIINDNLAKISNRNATFYNMNVAYLNTEKEINDLYNSQGNNNQSLPLYEEHKTSSKNLDVKQNIKFKMNSGSGLNNNVLNTKNSKNTKTDNYSGNYSNDSKLLILQNNEKLTTEINTNTNIDNINTLNTNDNESSYALTTENEKKLFTTKSNTKNKIENKKTTKVFKSTLTTNFGIEEKKNYINDLFNDNYLKDNQKEIDSELNSLNARNLYNYLNKT